MTGKGNQKLSLRIGDFWNILEEKKAAGAWLRIRRGLGLASDWLNSAALISRRCGAARKVCRLARTKSVPYIFRGGCRPISNLFLFFFFFILTLFDESGDKEYLAIGWEACIAHRGADRFGLSFGADPGVFFDAFQPLGVLFFIVLIALRGDLSKKMWDM